MQAKLRFKKDHVFKIMRDQEMPFWEIYGADNTTPALASDETNDLEGNIADLKDILNGIEGAYCHIRICNNPFPLGKGQPRGQKLHEFDVILSTERNRTAEREEKQQPAQGIGNISLLERIKDLEVKLIEQKHEHAAQLLEKKFEDFKKEQQESSPLGTLFEKMQPYLPAMLGMATPIAPGINGAPEEDKKKMLIAALNDLKQVDGNFETTICNIAKFAKAKPDEYKQYMGILAMQVQNI